MYLLLNMAITYLVFIVSYRVKSVLTSASTRPLHSARALKIYFG